MATTALRLTDGTTITGLVEPPQGLKHRIFFGIEEGPGREVAAKVELTAGALALERRALEWLTAQNCPAPRLLVAGTLEDSGEYPGAACLVVERVPGGPTKTLEGWERLGRALARLAAVPWEGSGLPTLGHAAFRDLHERRLADLSVALNRDLAAALPALPDAYAGSPLIITHSDPGPGNFVDDGVAGTLVDWEDAVVAPGGLDLGRARFIALLGVGDAGSATAERAARADAATAGFVAEAGRSAGDDPSSDPGTAAGARATAAPEELAWWLAVAGVQFAHWRLERAAVPGIPAWLDAVAELDAAFPPR